MSNHNSAFPVTPSTGGDGSTPERAVDLSAAHTEFEGITAEKTWLDAHFPGARVESQALLSGPPTMDLLTIKLSSGETREVYFNISSYFGKM
jgi:hypothetical protein